MIKCIKRTANEEYESLNSLWELAEKSKKELRQILKSIYNYYSNEE
jgi:autonomous glycyl radical cofactor GrcA